MRRTTLLLSLIAILLVVWAGWRTRSGPPLEVETRAASSGPASAGAVAGPPAASEPETEPRIALEGSSREEHVEASPQSEPSVAPEIRFHGRARSAADGSHVSGVIVAPAGGNAARATIEVEPASGDFVVRHTPPSGVPLALRAPGYAPVLFVTDQVHSAAERPAELRMQPAAELTARVVDASGAGVPAVRIRLRAEPLELRISDDLFADAWAFDAPVWEAHTDVFGDATLRDLPCVPLTVELTRDGDPPLRLAEPLRLPPGVKSAHIWTIGGGAVVYGRARDAEGGALADAEVWRLRAGGGMETVFRRDLQSSVLQKSRTDATGAFVMGDVPPGSWWIGLAPHPERASITLPLDLDVGEVRADVELVAHALLFIRGKVVDPDGHPIARARVVANQEGKLTHLSADLSGGDGSFALGPAVPGTYRINAGSGGGDLIGSETLEVEPGDEDIVLALRAGGVLRLRITDAHSGEAAPAAVQASPARGGREFAGFQRVGSHSSEPQIVSLELGEYDVLARTADGRVGVLRARARPSAEWREPLELRVSPGATLRIRSIGELGGVYEVWSGEVFVASNGMPAGSSVELSAPAGDAWIRWRSMGGSERSERQLTLVAGATSELEFGDVTRSVAR